MGGASVRRSEAPSRGGARVLPPGAHLHDRGPRARPDRSLRRLKRCYVLGLPLRAREAPRKARKVQSNSHTGFLLLAPRRRKPKVRRAPSAMKLSATPQSTPCAMQAAGARFRAAPAAPAASFAASALARPHPAAALRPDSPPRVPAPPRPPRRRAAVPPRRRVRARAPPGRAPTARFGRSSSAATRACAAPPGRSSSTRARRRDATSSRPASRAWRFRT